MGDFVSWVMDHGPGILQNVGIVGGLFFTGFALRADRRSRHADILMRLTENHRALWIYFAEHPELSRIFADEADLEKHPVTSEEARFVQFFINHVILTFRTRKLGLYISPDQLEMDLAEFFSRPVPRSAWEKLSRFQDKDFAAYMQPLVYAGDMDSSGLTSSSCSRAAHTFTS